MRRWEWRRAHAAQMGHKGRAGNSRGATEATNGETMICSRAGCGALVDRGAAYRQALARYKAHTGRRWCHWRESKLRWQQQQAWPYAAGDGCSSALCSMSHVPCDHREGQQRKAEELRDGKRSLIVWPTDVKDRKILVYDRDTVQRECARVEDAPATQHATPTRAERAAKRSKRE